MACLITVTGTSGSVLIRYTNGANPNTITASFGDSVYVPDAVTAATYTNISGDAAASSGCLTMTEAPKQLYQLTWEVFNCITPLKFIAVVPDGVEAVIDPVIYHTTDINLLAEAINNLDNDYIKAVAVNSVMVGQSYIASIILDTLDAETVELKIQGTEETETMYIKGTAASSIPLGFTEVDICPTILP
jgi:hypothetical protein